MTRARARLPPLEGGHLIFPRHLPLCRSQPSLEPERGPRALWCLGKPCLGHTFQWREVTSLILGPLSWKGFDPWEISLLLWPGRPDAEGAEKEGQQVSQFLPGP